MAEIKKKVLIVVVGPTGVGKTKLNIALARHYGTDVINADSRQMFKELKIGTAAPTTGEMCGVHHYFVGNLSVRDYYSASRFENDVLELLEKIFKRTDIALMSGGSMMYIDAVCDGIDDIPTVDNTTREEVKRMLNEQGLDVLVEKLKKLDPEHWAEVDKKNWRRVCHALEICLMTGKTYSSFRKKEQKMRAFEIIKIGLNRPREEMYERINERVWAMVDAGLEAEARRMYSFRTLNALNTVGYKEIFSFFDGEISKDEAIRQIQSNTRRYMRKQLTWLKRDDRIKWFEPEDEGAIVNYIDRCIARQD
jgi:tRNA dimethylallyltransferase